MRCKFAKERDTVRRWFVRSFVREREREIEEELFNLMIDVVRGDYRLIR